MNVAGQIDAHPLGSSSQERVFFDLPGLNHHFISHSPPSEQRAPCPVSVLAHREQVSSHKEARSRRSNVAAASAPPE